MEFYSLFQFIRTKDFHESTRRLSSKREPGLVCASRFNVRSTALKIADRINKNDGGEGRGETKNKKEKAERNANYKNEQ